MNETGFNLFTALVAIILVVLAAILANTMVDSERNVTDIISDIEEEQKMQTIADLAKADALHAFNFGIRFTIERWLTIDSDEDKIPDNRYVLTPEIASLSFEEIKKDFARTNFGICEVTEEGRSCEGRQLATRAANHLTALLERTPDVRGYSIDLDAPTTSELQQLLQTVFDKSSEEGDFFTVINCDGTWSGCKNGTFYINLNLRSRVEGGYLTEEEYEKFPQIVVTNRLTGRILKEPILPRGNVQIYVPLRLFKAISGGLEIAKGDGIFEGTFKSQVDILKVGVCGIGCTPIIDPFSGSTSEDLANYACAGDTLRGIEGSRLPDIQFVGFTDYLYDPNRERSMNTVLGKFVEEELLHPRIKEMVESRAQDQDNFKVVKDDGKAALSANAIVLAEPSRTVISVGETQDGTAYCSKVRRIEAIIVFEESDGKYIVSDVEGDGVNRYAVRLLDTTYSAFEPDLSSGSLPVCRTETGSGLNVYICTQG